MNITPAAIHRAELSLTARLTLGQVTAKAAVLQASVGPSVRDTVLRARSRGHVLYSTRSLPPLLVQWSHFRPQVIRPWALSGDLAIPCLQQSERGVFLRTKLALGNVARLAMGSSLVSAVLVMAGCGGGGSSPTTYGVGGTLQGLASGNSITLSNGADKLTVSTNGVFAIPVRLTDGAAYQVTVSATTPVSQICNLVSGAGTIKAASITGISVVCEANPLGVVATTGAMAGARAFHTATLLPNGMVLVKGGSTSDNGPGLKSSELYDSATGTWSSTGGPTAGIAPRYYHTATLLANGKVLVTGGAESTNISSSSELYDLASGSWMATGSLNSARNFHTATLLANGKVLVTGGRDSGGSVIATAELYDPVLGTWSRTATLNTPRFLHTATLLPGGKVLVTGGGDTAFQSINSSELYDPGTGSWSPAAPMTTARTAHTATTLLSGKVQVTGGGNVTSNFAVTSSELYDPTTGMWAPTGSLETARKVHAATLLRSGFVLATGGYGLASALPSNELYDPVTGSWTPTASFVYPRYGTTATLLPSGKVLVTGGSDTAKVPTAAGELYW